MTVTSTDLDEIHALIDDVALGVNQRDPDRCVARFTTDGDFDPAFGFDGKRAYNADGTGETNIYDFCSAVTGDGRRLFLLGIQGSNVGNRLSAFAIGQDDVFIDNFE